MSECLQTRTLRSGLPVLNNGVDPCLARSSGQHSRFSCFGDLWCSDDGASRKLDFFCQREKTNKLRLILDVRLANTRLLLPPCVELVSAEGLSRIERFL